MLLSRSVKDEDEKFCDLGLAGLRHRRPYHDRRRARPREGHEDHRLQEDRRDVHVEDEEFARVLQSGTNVTKLFCGVAHALE
jgi:hypothetical protein